MNQVPYFRTFVNEIGLPSCLRTWHRPSVFVPTLTVSQATLFQWYWRLSKLVVRYSYVINDFQIDRTLTAEFPLSTYDDRLRGDFGCSLSDVSEELGVGANFAFPLCQPIDTSVPDKANPTAPYTYPQSALLAPNAIAADKKLGLYCRLEENAVDGSFTLTNVVRLQPDDLATQSTVLATHTCPLMDGQTTFVLRTASPEDFEGKILNISFTPEFYEAYNRSDRGE